MRALEGLFGHRSNKWFLIGLVNNVTVAGVANQLCQACDDTTVSALLIAYNGKSCLGGVQSTNQDCTEVFELRVADETIRSQRPTTE